MSNSNIPLIFIQGSTSTGKSDLAIHLALQLGAEVVNCDSVQTYTKVDIGSAKPSLSDMEKVPHKLYDFVTPPDEITAGEYRDKALELINSATGPLIFVGGSGFYFTALENGMFEVEDVSQEIVDKLAAWESQKGVNYLYEELKKLDPETAAQLYPQDAYRIKRALGVTLQSNKKLSEIKKEFAGKNALKNSILKIGLWLDRAELLPLVEKRTHMMLQNGLVDEVKSLVVQGLKDWWPLKSVGYKEVVSYIDGQMTLQECEKEINKNTLRLAKKQRTWFKRDQQIRWYNPIVEKSNSWKTIEADVNNWLAMETKK